MKNIIDVQMGKVKTAKAKVILQSKAIGSCIAIVAYDPTRNIGGINRRNASLDVEREINSYSERNGSERQL